MDRGSLYDMLHNASILVDGDLLYPIIKDVVAGMVKNPLALARALALLASA